MCWLNVLHMVCEVSIYLWWLNVLHMEYEVSIYLCWLNVLHMECEVSIYLLVECSARGMGSINICVG